MIGLVQRKKGGRGERGGCVGVGVGVGVFVCGCGCGCGCACACACGCGCVNETRVLK